MGQRTTAALVPDILREQHSGGAAAQSTAVRGSDCRNAAIVGCKKTTTTTVSSGDASRDVGPD